MPGNRINIDGKLHSLRQLALLYGGTPDGSNSLMHTYVEKICSSLDSLYGLVEDFNDIQAMYSKKLQLHITTFDLMEVLHAVVEALARDVHSCELAVTLPDAGSTIEVTADRARFQRAIYYFLSSILVPAGEGGSALIGVDTQRQLLRVLVAVPAQLHPTPAIDSTHDSERAIRFFTAKELVRYLGGTLLCLAPSPRCRGQCIVSLPLHPGNRVTG